MAKVSVEPDWFFYTAVCLGQAASKLATGVSLATGDGGLLYSQKMAGNDTKGTDWGSAYDASTNTVLKGAASLATAWSSLAAKVHQAGVNHQIAEWEAGRRTFPGPNDAPPAPPISSAVASLPPSSVGDNGPGLDEVLPGLQGFVNEPAPNANSETLVEMAPAWTALGNVVNSALSEWIAKIPRPDPSMVDATALYDAIMKLNEPAAAISGDATKMASFTSGFGSAVKAFRDQSARALDVVGLEIGLIGIAIVLGTVVARKPSIVVAGARLEASRVRAVAEEIRGFIRALEPVVASMRTFVTALNPTMQGILDQTSIFPAEAYELQPDGTWKKVTRYFKLEKWIAWQRYQERGGQMDLDTWSDYYDRLARNRDDGEAFDQHAADLNDYSKSDGWIRQFGKSKEDWDKVPLPGRHWDWGNPDQMRVAENKKGRLDPDQMATDREVLERTRWTVVYNINANHQYTQAEEDWLAQMQRDFPGRFIVNRIDY